ncbi:MAG TPA: FkbM family methyltransferase [Polyangiaceae bacterium]|nr:FkbM family methyltransferase [Polyangiaceae bacterium]
MSQAAYTLPNGETIHHRRKYETEFLYREIFVNRVYLKHGIELSPGARVIDVGANIGLFSLFVKCEQPDAVVYGFEPAPELCEIAKLNTQRFGASVQLFALGLSDSNAVREFTYYPDYSIMSGFHAVSERDRGVLEQGIRTQLRALSKSAQSVNQKLVDALIAKKLEGSTRYDCPMTTLSSFIAETKLSRVDLLKIDAERCELEILRGVAETDWPKLQQIVVEAHDPATRDALASLLVARGYRIVVEQESQFTDSQIFNLYAFSPRSSQDPSSQSPVDRDRSEP